MSNQDNYILERLVILLRELADRIESGESAGSSSSTNGDYEYLLWVYFPDAGEPARWEPGKLTGLATE